MARHDFLTPIQFEASVQTTEHWCTWMNEKLMEGVTFSRKFISNVSSDNSPNPNCELGLVNVLNQIGVRFCLRSLRGRWFRIFGQELRDSHLCDCNQIRTATKVNQDLRTRLNIGRLDWSLTNDGGYFAQIDAFAWDLNIKALRVRNCQIYFSCYLGDERGYYKVFLESA